MSKRTSARVFDVLACWPPGPPEPENRHSNSSGAIAHDRVIRRWVSSVIGAPCRRIVLGIRQTGAMAIVPRARLAFAAIACCGAVALGGCGGSSHPPKSLGPNPTSSDPGPNTTTFDPGPNPTGNGPVTIEGTLQITPTCLSLQRAGGKLDLHFSGYTKQGTTLIDDTKTAVAKNGDDIAVAGHPQTTKNACGTRFDVDNLVTVLPK